MLRHLFNSQIAQRGMRCLVAILSLIASTLISPSWVSPSWAGVKASHPSQADMPLPSLCDIIEPRYLNGRACTEKVVHWAVKKARRDSTAINIQDLHQATYRDPYNALTSLTFQGFVGPKRDDIPPVPLISPINWYDVEYDRNWRFNLNAWKMMEPMMALHAKSGEHLPLHMAMHLVRDWIDYNVTQKQPNDLKWYDIGTGQRAMKLAYMIDQAYRGNVALSDADKGLLLALSHIHITKMLDPTFINPGNHGTFQVHGLKALCRTLPVFKACQKIGPYIAAQMEKLVIGQYGTEAMHMEHSAEYHFFMYKVFDRLFSTGWYDDLDVTKGLLRRVEENKRWLIFPNGEVTRHGDTDVRFEPLPSGDPEIASPACIEIADRIADCTQMKVFAQTGYATVRSAWETPADQASMLFLMGAYHSHAHKQKDHLSIELFERGLPILIDSGKFAYDPDNPKRDYALSTRAHNTVEIDGTDYVRNKRQAVGSMLQHAEKTTWGYRLDAGVFHPEQQTQHDRTLAYRPGRWLLVVDRLKADKERTFEQWFHLHETLEAKMHDTGYIIPLPDGSQVRATVSSSSHGCILRRVRGQQEPRLQGWTSREYNSFLPNDAVGHACAGQDVTLTTLFVIEDADSPADVVLEAAMDADLRVVDQRDKIRAQVAVGQQQQVHLPNSVPDQTEVIGIAAPDGSGFIVAQLRDVAFQTTAGDVVSFDEMEVVFPNAIQTSEAFVLTCQKRQKDVCLSAPVQTEVGHAAHVMAAVDGYYEDGGFASGTLTLSRHKGQGRLSGQVMLTLGSADQIITRALNVNLEAHPIAESQVATFTPVVDADAVCQSNHPGPLFSEIALDRYETQTFSGVAATGANPDKVNVLIRHDVDRSLHAMRQLMSQQAALGLKATYFVNLASGYAAAMSRRGDYVFNDHLLHTLVTAQEHGFEVGYHTDALFLDLFHGLPLEQWLPTTLTKLRDAGLMIQSEAANGSRYGRLIGSHNRYTFADYRAGGQWTHLVHPSQTKDVGYSGQVNLLVGDRTITRTLPQLTMSDVGLKHSAYYPETFGVSRQHYMYLTDSNLSASEMIKGLRQAKPGQVVQVLMHPWRWTNCD